MIIHIYTGDGKGKTTAAIGQGIRAAGQGLSVRMIQFLKSPKLSSGEVNIVKHIAHNFIIKRLDTPWWSLSSFRNKAHITKIKIILEDELLLIQSKVATEPIDILILDEINVCLHYGFVKTCRLIDFLESLPSCLDVILTGRNAPSELIEKSDLVTEMKMVRHPYSKGIKARKGIEY